MSIQPLNEDQFESEFHSAIPELKSKLWAMSYERTSNIVCCENCGTTSTVTRLMASNSRSPLLNPESPALDSEISCVDDRFDIIRKLGSGGMGAVYLVHDRILKKPFALKMLREDLHRAGDVTLDKRFEMEARAALEMTHVNVVGAYCQGRHQTGAPYLVMDYIEGESLADILLRDKRLEAHSALNIFIQVCQALSHAHTKSLIHRDIKPANILLQKLTSAGAVVKLVDFGIAKSIPLFNQETLGLTSTGLVVGSPAYMSPEQCLGEDLAEQSDIYSLGCVMYETLTGKPPFYAKNSIRTIMDHVKSEPEPFASTIHIDEQLIDNDIDLKVYRQAIESVVFKCLEKDSERRYQSADELRIELEYLSENKLPKLLGKEKSIDIKLQKSGNSEAAFALLVLLTIFALIAAFKICVTL